MRGAQSKQINFVLKRPEYLQLRAKCRREGRVIAETMRGLVELWLSGEVELRTGEGAAKGPVEKSVEFAFDMPVSERERLREFCARRGVTMAAFCRTAIIGAMEEAENGE